MITFNHANYIKQAIEGVLNQQTSFQIELIIGEDCSTDNTREICIGYQKKYPDKIKLNLSEQNQGMMKNFIRTIKQCTGQYIAICEGDDYWTDRLKLHKQVKYLDKNPEFSICFHNVIILDERNNTFHSDFITKDVSDITTIYNLAEENYIHTPSVMFKRNEKVLEELDNLGDIGVGDYPLHLLNSQYGKIKKLKDTMCIYRYGTGTWSGNNNWEKKSLLWLALLKKLINHFRDKGDIANILRIQYGKNAKLLYDIYNANADQKANTLLIDSAYEIYLWQNHELQNLMIQITKLRASKAYKVGKLIMRPLSLIKHNYYDKYCNLFKK